MNRIGICGLDSSHPDDFARILDDFESTSVSAIWDGGDVRTPGYAESFAERFDATLYDDPTDFIDEVDGALVLTVNWDLHRALAVPLLRAGVPTLIDKPIAGNVSDVRALAEAATNAPLFGGSAVPFHPSLADFPIERPGRTLYGAGYNDPFYYGGHLTDTARRLAGSNWRTVTPTAGPGTTVDVAFENDTYATIRLDGSAEDGAFGLLDVSGKTRTALVGDSQIEREQMYTEFLSSFVDVLRGDRDETDLVIDSARLLLAANVALETGNSVTPGSEQLSEAHFDGAAFLESYRPYVAIDSETTAFAGSPN